MKKAIIVDIDGTLALKGDRDIFDYSKVHLDKPNKPVITVIQALQNQTQYVLIIMSGRESSCRKDTADWLIKHDVLPDKILMRNNGDHRKDAIVKKELYDTHIKGKFDVEMVFDDRKQVKKMWVDEGLFVFDVNQRDIIF